ncbi:MAG: cation diffusion facilitator family transporter [Deltaproteobacteria bacterium]|nr:cation diffusion facilitator family transporter [Deltaproteobacteria bacterium]
MAELTETQLSTLKSRTATLSIFSNGGLIVIKLIAGVMTGSVAIISEAVHSFLDLMASFMAWAAVRVSDAPADYDHPFGHGKTENLAALFEALLIVVGGIYIIKEAIEGLIEGRDLPDLKIGLAVMFFSALVNVFISRRLFKIGHETQSPALVADGWHLMTDVYTSGGIFTALLVIEVGGFINPEWDLTRIDGLSAAIVAFMIIRTGCSLGWEAIGNLIDHSLSPQEIALIKEHIEELHPAIQGYRRLRTRRSGPFRLAIVDLIVDGCLTVNEAHLLGSKVVAGIKSHYPTMEVTFHLEPVEILKHFPPPKNDLVNIDDPDEEIRLAEESHHNPE